MIRWCAHRLTALMTTAPRAGRAAWLAARTALLGLLAGPLALPAVPARAATLRQVLGEVLAGNRDLEAQRWQAAAARARAVRAGSWESPVLEVGVENVPVTGRFDQDPMTMKVIGVTQRVPVFGANRIARRAENEQARADGLSLVALRWERAGDAWQAYAQAYFAGTRAAAAEGHRGVMQRMVGAARARYEAGRGRLDDVLRAQAEAARVDADAATWRAAEAEARARLAELRGRSPTETIEALESPPVLDVGADARPWIDAALRHPRVLEQDARGERYRMAARAARRSAWPELELRAAYGRRETLVNPIHGTAAEQDNMFSATLGFTLPLFAGSREGAEAREMDAMAHAAEAERGGAALALEQAVVAAHARALAGSRTVRLIADTVLVLQQRSLDAAWSAYAAGSADLMGVFETAHALYAEELREADEREALARADAQLIALTGRLDLIGVSIPGATGGKDQR